MDTSKIPGPGFFPDNSLNQIKKTDQKKTDVAKKKESTEQATSSDDGELGALFKLPPHKVVSKLTSLLEKSLSDPKVEKLLTQYQIPAGSKQALAFCTLSCLKSLLGKKLALSPEDEKAVMDAIIEEFEEDVTAESLDPDERKKKQDQRKQKRKQRRSKSKPSVNAVMTLVEECMKTLEKSKGGFSLQS
ncbi:MAG: hypothetical protein SFU25_06695 [Candidatus Caenarcaniphilales bacterium]|nr:hypothetical protein [Candidatus Caenarcaniphilales bacterium]